MKRIVRRGLVVAGVGAAAVLVLFGPHGLPVRWELPDSYRGWVVMRWSDPTCPPLRRDGIFWVVPISRSGEGCTSRDSLFRAWQHVLVTSRPLAATHMRWDAPVRGRCIRVEAADGSAERAG